MKDNAGPNPWLAPSDPTATFYLHARHAQPTVRPTPAPTFLQGGSSCVAAKSLAVGPNTFKNSATGSTVSTSSVGCFTGTFDGGASVYNTNWFYFIPSISAPYAFSTCSSANFDTKIVVQSSCTLSSSTLVACNNDGTGCSGTCRPLL